MAFFNQYKKVPQSGSITDALTMFSSLTQVNTIERTRLHQRYARDGKHLLVDLGWSDGQVVDIDSTGWRVREQTERDQLFKRPRKLNPMPAPASGDGFVSFHELAHVEKTNADLMSAWMVAAMFPDHPQPMPVFDAPPGAGKTSLAAAMLSTLDPGAKLGAPPRADRSWEVVLDQSYGAGFDNLSYIGQDESDRLARAITGDETETRTLYTTDEITTMVFKPRLIATTIGLSNLRGDLANRMIPVELLPPSEFIDEESFAAMVHDAMPKILGSMFDAAANVLSVIETVNTPVGFRMATFARLLAAFDATQGTEAIKAYKVAQERIFEASLDSNRLWPFLADVTRDRNGDWTASAGEVREQLLDRLRLGGEATKAILMEAEGKSGRLRSAQTTGNLLTELSVSAGEHGWSIEKLPHHGAQRQWWMRAPQAGGPDAQE